MDGLKIGLSLLGTISLANFVFQPANYSPETRDGIRILLRHHSEEDQVENFMF
jgi:hypothetical protein